MSYFKRRGKYYLFCLFIVLSFNLYFIFLIRGSDVSYLSYLDFLLLVAFLLFLGVDYAAAKKTEKEKSDLMRQGIIVSQQISDFENKDIAEHDVWVLNEKLQQAFDENCELQDYVAKWSHELKIPLAASLLMVEKIEDADIGKAMREQLEKINRQLSSLLLGCKIQSALFDLQIKRTSLQECVKTSIQNNQFFLIQKDFAMNIQIEPLYVYSDPSWLVYVLDQLLNNAVKYAKEKPGLHIWTEKNGETVKLWVKDDGEGIKSGEIRRIFEKGFTGSNYHNGKYKSTGMGLYMASKIITRLGHTLSVESEYGEYTKFCIIFEK